MEIDYIITENVIKQIILIDSKSLVNAINNTKMNGNSFLWNTINKIEKLKRERKYIHIVWIRGHEGIAGNEKADQFARQASESENSTMRIPVTGLETVIKNSGIKQWQRIYEHESKKKGKSIIKN